MPLRWEDPAYVMEQLGHTDPKLALRMYTRAMRRPEWERALAPENEKTPR